LIIGRFGHCIFPDSVIFEQIQRDSSRLESVVLYAVDCFQKLKACGSFDVDEQQSEAMAFLSNTHSVQSSDDSGSILSSFPYAVFLGKNSDVGFHYKNYNDLKYNGTTGARLSNLFIRRSGSTGTER
jgi:hypothetical protein